MVNEVLIQTRITKKPLRTEGKFVEVVHIRLLMNGITLYETNSDIYTMSAQELTELMLDKSSLLIQALEKVENSKVSIRHGSY
jgi:hypothetical protein